MAEQLPNALQVFLDDNGDPVQNGTVAHYVPSTLTFKATWQDEAETILNANPVLLDSAGRAAIFGTGAYRQILRRADNTIIWDKLTYASGGSFSAFAGTSSGFPDQQILSFSGFTNTQGDEFTFEAGFTNTGPTTLVVNGNLIPVRRASISGPVPLTGGEIVTGNAVRVVLIDGAFQIMNPSLGSGAFVNIDETQTSVAAGTTVDLGVLATRNVLLTGTTPVASFGSTASLRFPYYYIRAAAALTIQNSAGILCPGGTNLLLRPDDAALLRYQGSGVWSVVDVWRRTGNPDIGAVAGFTAQNNSANPNTQIDVAWTSALLTRAAGNSVRHNSGTLTLNAATVGVNGMDTGALAANTWYYLWLISDGTNIGTLLSLSSTAPTLPTDYVFAERVGSWRTNASSQLRRLFVVGKRHQHRFADNTDLAAAGVAVAGIAYSLFNLPAMCMPPVTRHAIIQTVSGPSFSPWNPSPATNVVVFIVSNATYMFDVVLEASGVFYAYSFGGSPIVYGMGFVDSTVCL